MAKELVSAPSPKHSFSNHPAFASLWRGRRMDTNKHEFVVEAAVSAANVFRFAREDTRRYT